MERIPLFLAELVFVSPNPFRESGNVSLVVLVYYLQMTLLICSLK